jgi:hypothetical protein
LISRASRKVFNQFVGAFGSTVGAAGPMYDINLDADLDGSVKVTDLAAFTANFGTTWIF